MKWHEGLPHRAEGPSMANRRRLESPLDSNRSAIRSALRTLQRTQPETKLPGGEPRDNLAPC